MGANDESERPRQSGRPQGHLRRRDCGRDDGGFGGVSRGLLLSGGHIPRAVRRDWKRVWNAGYHELRTVWPSRARPEGRAGYQVGRLSLSPGVSRGGASDSKKPRPRYAEG